jgi:acyl-CoA dehydrogenase
MADQTFALLRDTLRRFVDKEVVPRAQAWEAQGYVPREVLRQMGALGFLGLRYAEEVGGGALDARATALLAEELGRSTFGGFAITVLVHTDMARRPPQRRGRAVRAPGRRPHGGAVLRPGG